jgi:hypothetical protein
VANHRTNPPPSLLTDPHRPTRTGATVFFSCPRAIHGGSGTEPSHQRCTARRRTSPVRRPSAAPRRPPSRANFLRPRSPPAKGRRTGTPSPPPVRFRNGSKPVPAFVVALCPAPPVSTQTRPPLPCSSPRRAPAHSYSRATPGLGFSNTRGTCPLAPEVPLPAATALPRLVMAFARPVTSLEGVTPRAVAVCPGLPPGHSFRRLNTPAISGGRR